jgi:glycosyltransferase involved in cell wall biosynthesis
VKITVAIPTIPPREQLFRQACESVVAQTLSAECISVAVDFDREGAARTRQKALDVVETDWVAFLDDDDRLLPEHLQVLADAARESGADYLYSYFYLDQRGKVSEQDPLGHFGKPFDPDNPQDTTITILVRTELAKAVGFTGPQTPLQPLDVMGEDRRFLFGCLSQGATVLHVPRRTWIWSHHGANTSGRSDRW